MKQSTTALIVSLGLGPVLLASAQFPSILSYQGRVTANGTNVDGTGYFKFAMVDGGSNTANQATATAAVNNGFITGFTVTSGGGGYSSPPAVTIADPSGSNAVATAVIAGGAVVSITVNTPGSHYSSRPTITVAAPPPNMVFQTFWSNDRNSGMPASSIALPLDNGLFCVLLGDTNVPNMPPLPPEVFTNNDVRLRVWFCVTDDYFSFQQMAPDQRIGAVGYAISGLNAGFASTSGVALAVSPGADVQGQRLNVGTNNVLGGPWTTLAGGRDNSALSMLATVSGGEGNSAAGSYAAVGGGQSNVISAGLAFIGGGQGNVAGGGSAFIGGGGLNSATSPYATIGGGSSNSATNDHATIGGGANNTADYYATVGGGLGNMAIAFYATVGGGTGNTASDVASVVAGGLQNVASSHGAAVGGGLNNVAGGKDATVAGGIANQATGAGSVVGGGGSALGISPNLALGDGATVAGGFGNSATNRGATVGGGESNWAYGADSAVAGGSYNQALGPGAFIGGGGFDGNQNCGNSASGPVSAVLGGKYNAASGYAATAAGGALNSAQGAYSFAAGINANAANDGCFVWSDGQSPYQSRFYSTGSNQFVIHASGGVGINTSYLPQGGLVIDTNAFLNGYDLFLRGNDRTCGLGWYGQGKLFGDYVGPNGPVLYGANGGGLGIATPAQIALNWDQTGIMIPQQLRVLGPAQLWQGLSVGGAVTVGQGLYVTNGAVIGQDLIINGQLRPQAGGCLSDQDLYFRGSGDHNHGVGWYGSTKPFGTNAPGDGPVLYGNGGGALGTMGGDGPQLALKWTSSVVQALNKLSVSGDLGVSGKSYLQNMNVYGDVDIGGNMDISGALEVIGLKLFVAPHPTDPDKEIGYVAIEGPEAATFARGSTNLVNGEAVICLPQTYAMVTAEDGLTVQVTPRGEWLQLYVAQVNPRQLTVREAQGKSGRLDYLVQGVRKGYENYQPIRPRRQSRPGIAH